MAERITDAMVKALEAPAAGNRIVYDGGHRQAVAGFGVRVTAGGAKSFVLNYRNVEGRERRYTIGTYGPNEWSVEGARKRAGELKRAIARGDDPLGDKAATRAAPTVADLCDRYEEDHLPRKRPSSQQDDRAMMAQIIRPRLGARKVAAVAHADIDKLHRDLKATPYRANRALALASKMFSLAVRWGWRADNPARGVERYPEAKRTRYLAPDELKRLTEALAAYPEAAAAKARRRGDRVRRETVAEARRVAQAACDAIRLCLLTGCRRGEALSARWADIDLDGGIWRKPGATTKQKTEHVAPLGAAAVTLLRGILASAAQDGAGRPESPFVFPGPAGETHLADLRQWEEIRGTAGIVDVRLHDLRHTFASMLASAGASLPMIGALLGHTQPSTTARYAHLFQDPLRKLADTVGAAVTGAPQAEVVPMRREGGA